MLLCMYSFDDQILCGRIDVLSVCTFDTQCVLVGFRKKKSTIKRNPPKLKKPKPWSRRKCGGFYISKNHKSRKNSDIQIRVCMTKGIGAVKARVELVFHSSYCPVAQEGQCSQQQCSIVCVCVVSGLLVCIMFKCFVCLCRVVCCALLYFQQDVLLQASASHACVCNWTAGTFVVQLSAPCYLCFARAVLPCPGWQLDAALYKGKNVCSIWVEGVMGEKCVAVLSPWSVSLLACAGLRCAPHHYRDPKCSDLVATAAN